MKNEKGFTLIEVIIGLALLGVVAVAFLGALSTASAAVFINDERATAESLARSQMEYAKNQLYITAPGGGEATYSKIDSITDGYAMMSINRADEIVDEIIGVPWDTQNNQPSTTDDGIQRIMIVVKHHGKEIFTFIRDGKKITLENYKVDR